MEKQVAIYLIADGRRDFQTFFDRLRMLGKLPMAARQGEVV